MGSHVNLCHLIIHILQVCFVGTELIINNYIARVPIKLSWRMYRLTQIYTCTRRFEIYRFLSNVCRSQVYGVKWKVVSGLIIVRFVILSGRLLWFILIHVYMCIKATHCSVFIDYKTQEIGSVLNVIQSLGHDWLFLQRSAVWSPCCVTISKWFENWNLCYVNERYFVLSIII